MGVIIVVQVRVKNGLEEEFAVRYAALERRVAEGLDGHVSHRLCRELDDSAHWAIISVWESLEASQAWDASAEHRELLTPMRECWDEVRRSRYDVRSEQLHPLRGS